MTRVAWTDLGRARYGPVLELQRSIVGQRKRGRGRDRLLLVEHEPVITMGRRSDAAHVLVDKAELETRGIELYEVGRGGDVTYHGPGQLVAYPILDLRGHRKDVRWYAGALLATVVRTLDCYGIEAHTRLGDEAGVWLGTRSRPQGKIAALGVRIERWITYHGLALNVAPDMRHFGLIVPCGHHGATVSAMRDVVPEGVTVRDVVPCFLEAFAAVFDVELERDALAVGHAGRAGRAVDPATPLP